VSKSRDAFRTISEVADHLELPQHVLRFWETKFTQIKPMKRGGNRRYYRPEDVDLLITIRQLLHEDGLTIRGAQKLFKDQGLKSVVANCLAGNLPGGLQAEEARRVSHQVDLDSAPAEETAPIEQPLDDSRPAYDMAGDSVLSPSEHGGEDVSLRAVHDQLVALRRMISV